MNLCRYHLTTAVFWLYYSLEPSTGVPGQPQFILTLGLAYWISMANVFFRDTQQLLTVALRLLFYLTPVVYDARVIPVPYVTLYRLNPLVHLLDAYRAILIRGELPDGLILLGLSLFGGALLWSGQSVFQRVSYRLIEEL